MRQIDKVRSSQLLARETGKVESQDRVSSVLTGSGIKGAWVEEVLKHMFWGNQFTCFSLQSPRD